MFNTKLLLLDLISEYNWKVARAETDEGTVKLLKLVEEFDERIRIAIASERGIDGLSGEQTELLNRRTNKEDVA